MSDAIVWIYATSKRATFAVGVSRSGRVVSTAPYARRWLIGKRHAEAVAELERRGFRTRMSA